MTLPPATGRPYRISLVCLDNICRSPMAAAVLRHRVDETGLAELVAVDSAGTGSWHVGDHADPRARTALALRGYDGEMHRARQFQTAWFDDHDLVLAMDHDNARNLRRAAPDRAAADRVVLLREFDPEAGAGPDRDVPDPYFGDERDFDAALDIIERSVDGLMASLRSQM